MLKNYSKSNFIALIVIQTYIHNCAYNEPLNILSHSKLKSFLPSCIFFFKIHYVPALNIKTFHRNKPKLKFSIQTNRNTNISLLSLYTISCPHLQMPCSDSAFGIILLHTYSELQMYTLIQITLTTARKCNLRRIRT